MVTIEQTARDRIFAARHEAETKAWDSLARYKFVMFGYWAGVWVHENQLMEIWGETDPNPFRELVAAARQRGFGP